MIKVLKQDKTGSCDCANFYCVGNEVRTAFTENWFETLGKYETDCRAKEIVSEMFGEGYMFIMPEK